MPILLMGSWRNHSARGSVPSALAAHTSPIGPMVAVCWPAQRPIWRRENKHLCQMKSCESPWENLMLGSCPLHPRIQYDCCIYIYNTIYIYITAQIQESNIHIYIYTHMGIGKTICQWLALWTHGIISLASTRPSRRLRKPMHGASQGRGSARRHIVLDCDC